MLYLSQRIQKQLYWWMPAMLNSLNHQLALHNIQSIYPSIATLTGVILSCLSTGPPCSPRRVPPRSNALALHPLIQPGCKADVVYGHFLNGRLLHPQNSLSGPTLYHIEAVYKKMGVLAQRLWRKTAAENGTVTLCAKTKM